MCILCRWRGSAITCFLAESTLVIAVSYMIVLGMQALWAIFATWKRWPRDGGPSLLTSLVRRCVAGAGLRVLLRQFSGCGLCDSLTAGLTGLVLFTVAITATLIKERARRNASATSQTFFLMLFITSVPTLRYRLSVKGFRWTSPCGGTVLQLPFLGRRINAQKVRQILFSRRVETSLA